jgi:hypothetical protein
MALTSPAAPVTAAGGGGIRFMEFSLGNPPSAYALRRIFSPGARVPA